MPKPRWAVWADAVAFVGEFKLPDVISVNIEDILKVVTHKQGDGGCMFSFPTGRDVKGEIAFNAIDADLLNLILGGTKTTGTKSNVRFGTENHTITFSGTQNGGTYSIMLASGNNVQKETIEIYDENLIHYKKTDIYPPSGQHEFHPKDTGRIYFNPADGGKVVYPSYLYADATGGSKIAIAQNDIPSRLELWAVMRARNLNMITAGYEDSDIVIHLTKVRRTGPLVVGSESEEQTSSWSFEFVADLIDNGDYEVYFPKDRIRTMILLEDYDGNNICDYDGELIGIGYTEAWG